jgi:hypothetical protein
VRASNRPTDLMCEGIVLMPPAAHQGDDILDVVPELRLVAAGVAGLVMWECFARFVAPLWVGTPLAPAPLIRAMFGIDSGALAVTVHAVAAVVIFPAVFLLLTSPTGRWPGSIRLWPVAGPVFGVGLWAVAAILSDRAFGDRSSGFLWRSAPWASLAGHTIYGLALAGALAWFDLRARAARDGRARQPAL